MSTEMPTPRTDGAIVNIDVAFLGFDGVSSSPEQYVEPDFARQLERELEAAKARIAELERLVNASLNLFERIPLICVEANMGADICQARRELREANKQQ